MKKRLTISEGSLLALLIFISLAMFLKGKGPTNLILALLSVATFLFGIFGAFVMQDRDRRLDELRKVLRTHDSDYISLYVLAGTYGKKIQKKVQNLIDDYFVSTIDYKLIDFHKAHSNFLKLYTYLANLKPKNSRQAYVFSQLLDVLNEANEKRKYIEYLTRNTMLKFNWVILLGLLAVILFSIFYINDGSLPSIIISVLLSTISVIFLLILRELDTLSWKEQGWIWDPLEQFFSEIGALPYYPIDVIMAGRVKLKKGTNIRVAYYPKPYPDFTGKKVKIETVQ